MYQEFFDESLQVVNHLITGYIDRKYDLVLISDNDSDKRTIMIKIFYIGTYPKCCLEASAADTLAATRS